MHMLNSKEVYLTPETLNIYMCVCVTKVSEVINYAVNLTPASA